MLAIRNGLPRGRDHQTYPREVKINPPPIPCSEVVSSCIQGAGQLLVKAAAVAVTEIILLRGNAEDVHPLMHTCYHCLTYAIVEAFITTNLSFILSFTEERLLGRSINLYSLQSVIDRTTHRFYLSRLKQVLLVVSSSSHKRYGFRISVYRECDTIFNTI